MTFPRALALAVLLLAVTAAPAAAQCAMCYNSAAAQDSEAIKALNLGILVLLIPPVAIMASILLLAFRYRNADHTEAEPTASTQPSRKIFRLLSSSTG